MISVALPLSTNIVTHHRMPPSLFSSQQLIFHVPSQSFQGDLLHDLDGHKCETDRTVAFHIAFSFFSLSKTRGCIPFFPVSRNFIGLPQLLSSSTSSLRIHGYIPSGPTDLCNFSVLRWSWTWTSLSVDGSLFCQKLSLPSVTWVVWLKDVPLKTEAKKCPEKLVSQQHKCR